MKRQVGTCLFICLLCNESEGVSCDEQFLIGRNDPDFDFGIGLGNLAELALDAGVCDGVDLDAEDVHLGADSLTYIRCILTDTARKQHGIQTVHGSGIRTDVFLDFIDEHFLGEGGFFVAVFSGSGHIPVVGAYAGYSEEAGLLVHIVGHLFRGHVSFFHDESDSGRVKTAAASAHDETVKRGKAH